MKVRTPLAPECELRVPLGVALALQPSCVSAVSCDLHEQSTGELGIDPRQGPTARTIGAAQARARQAAVTNDRQEATFEGALAAGVDHRVDQCATVPGIRSQVVDDSSAQPLLADKTHSDGRIDGVVYLLLSKSEEKRIEDQSLGL